MEIEQSALQECVLGWGEAELNAFYADVDISAPSLPVTDTDAHWLSRAVETRAKKNGEQSPMYRMGGQLYSKQRIAYILEWYRDPVKMDRVQTKCGIASCINPYHMNIIEPVVVTAGKRKRVNKF